MIAYEKEIDIIRVNYVLKYRKICSILKILILFKKIKILISIII